MQISKSINRNGTKKWFNRKRLIATEELKNKLYKKSSD
jgi:hypothetical protein